MSKKNDISAKGEVSTDNKSERLNDFCVSTKACSSSQCTLVCGEKMVQDVYWERKAILEENVAQYVLVMQTMVEIMTQTTRKNYLILDVEVG